MPNTDEILESSPRSLEGLTVLVVDDDYLVANDCATVLREQGANVVGPVQDMSRARASMFGSITDCVLLDINLKGEMAFSLAEELIAHGVPLIFTTGYDACVVPESMRNRPCLLKPLETRDLVMAIRRETSMRPKDPVVRQ